MIPDRRTFLVAGLLTFVAGLVLLFPARVAYQWFVPQAVQLSGIEGSIWSGSAREMSAGGVYLRDFRWRLRPLRLLTGKLALSIDATPSSGFIEANVAFGFGGDITVSELSGSVPLQAFAAVARMPGLAGNASVQFPLVQLRDGLPVAVEGTFAVAGLIAPLVDPAPLGGYRAEFFTNEDRIVASVEDADGVFDLAGSLSFFPDRSYKFIGQVAATERTSAKLRKQLRFLGSPNDRGQHEIRLEGTL